MNPFYVYRKACFSCFSCLNRLLDSLRDIKFSGNKPARSHSRRVPRAEGVSPICALRKQLLKITEIQPALLPKFVGRIVGV
jgi:hypothetical protein